ncbi:MAG: AMP-binding protein [Clostridia bacterium]|nr:AMP-binding protein [Clostridia bacterium]
MKQQIRIKNQPKTERVYTPVSNITEQLEVIRNHGDRTAYLWNAKEGDGVLTYARLAENVVALAAAQAASGLRDEARVVVIGNTSHMWMEAYLSTLTADNVVVPMDKELSETAIEGFIQMIDAKAVFFAGSLAATMVAIAARNPSLIRLVQMEEDAPLPEEADERFSTFEDYLALGQTAVSAGYTPPVVTDNRKMAQMLFTSGTTGSSKCVMLCQENIFSVVSSACATVDFSPEDTIVSVLPIHHTYELACELALMNYGGTIAINDSLRHVVQNFQKYKPTGLVLVPLFVNTLYKRIWSQARSQGKEHLLHYGAKVSNALLSVGVDIRKKLFAQVRDAFGGNLKKIICGGAALAPSMIYAFESFGISIYEGFGITECSPLTNVTPYYARKPGSVGPAVPCCTVRIEPDGNLSDDGYETGEIQVQGSNVMLGYYGNSEATAQAFTADGWFRTGDIGYMDPDGYLYITGRSKSVIVLENGKNVFPEEIEEYLEPLEQIAECVVVGRVINGSTNLVALIYPAAEYSKDKTAQEMETFFHDEIAKINKNLPSFKQVHMVELVDHEFQKTTSRKIIRYLVK